MSICDLPALSGVCAAAGQGAASLVTAPFEWLATAMGNAAAWLYVQVWAVFDTTTTVDITSAGYLSVYNIVFGVAVFVMLLFFCLQLIGGVIRREPAALGRAAIGLAKSVLGSFLVITLTGLLLEITDQLCVGIVHATGNTMAGIGDRIALLAGALAVVNVAGQGAGAIVTIFLAGLAISGAFIVWFSLLIRKSLLLVAIAFAPIALAGASWDATRGWVSKWAGFVIAMVVSKLVLVVLFLIAVTQVAAPITSDLSSISEPISGIVLMFIGAFAPYMTYKFLHFASFDLYHAMSAEQEAKQSLNRPIPLPSTAPPTGGLQKVLGGDSAPPAAPASGGASAAAGESAGAGVGAEAAGAGAGAGAVAGPIGIAVVAAAEVGSAAATTGPHAGGAIGGSASGQADSATAPSSPPVAPRPPTGGES